MMYTTPYRLTFKQTKNISLENINISAIVQDEVYMYTPWVKGLNITEMRHPKGDLSHLLLRLRHFLILNISFIAARGNKDQRT